MTVGKGTVCLFSNISSACQIVRRVSPRVEIKVACLYCNERSLVPNVLVTFAPEPSGCRNLPDGWEHTWYVILGFEDQGALSYV
jgi:hypothetical protein